MEPSTGFANVVINTLVNSTARRAIKYISPSLVVRATRRTFRGKIAGGNLELSVTIGRPNYSERLFINKCIKAHEPFPIRKIQLKYLAQRG